MKIINLLYNLLDNLSNKEGDQDNFSNPEEVKDRVE